MSVKGESADFQQLQLAMTHFVRNPEGGYQGESAGGLPVEERRLNAYASLFFSNIHDFIQGLFPILSEILGERRTQQLAREFLKKHRAQTPLFHELGEEFLTFLQTEYEAQPEDPPWLFELAHYEWVELALLAEEGEHIPEGREGEFEEPFLERPLKLSALAWPLAYQWPVDQISAQTYQEIAPEFTAFLVYRDAEHLVQFMRLTPMLAQLLWPLKASESPLSFNEIWQAWVAEQKEEEHEALLRLKPQAQEAFGVLVKEGLIVFA
jgi:hypothetical protein